MYGFEKRKSKRDKFLDLVRELRMLWNMRVPVIPIVTDVFGMVLLRVGKDTGRVGNHSNHRITEIGQNTEKSPGDSWKLAVTHTPIENHQLTLV